MSRNAVLKEDELDRIADLLHVAQVEMLECAAKLERTYSGAAIIERLRCEAEYCQDVRERIGAR